MQIKDEKPAIIGKFLNYRLIYLHKYHYIYIFIFIQDVQ